MTTRKSRNSERKERTHSGESAASGGLSQASTTTIKDASNSNPVKTIDVAIIGGGIAGLYTAWRLQGNPKDEKKQPEQNAKDLRVRLYEATSNVGGRLCSVWIQGLAIPAELGAMRYSTRHKLLDGLIKYLRLSSDSFEVPESTYYIRGRRLLPDTIRNNSCHHCSAAIPFNLRDSERGKLPGELIEQAIWKALSDLNFHGLEDDEAALLRVAIGQRSLSNDDWRKIKNHGQYRDIHLYNMGFWNLLQHYLSNEAFLLAHDGLGYESIVGNWNAAEALQWFVADFGKQDYFMLREGLQTLAKKLEALIVPEKPNNLSQDRLINVNHELGAISQDENDKEYPWQLEFTVKEKDGRKRKEKEKVKAKYLILALPRNALGKLKVEIPEKENNVQPDSKKGRSCKWRDWPEFTRVMLSSIRSHSLFKLFLVYQYPWWTGDPLPNKLSGRVCTDLPIRQIYYFGPDWIKKHSDPGQSRRAKNDFQTASNMENLCLVMASYSDAHYVSFWRPLSPRDRDGTYSEEHDLRTYQSRPHLFNKKTSADKLLEIYKTLSERGQVDIALLNKIIDIFEEVDRREEDGDIFVLKEELKKTGINLPDEVVKEIIEKYGFPNECAKGFKKIQEKYMKVGVSIDGLLETIKNCGEKDSSVDRLIKTVEEYGAPERMVQKVQEQLAEVHGIHPDIIPAPIAAIYRDWGQASFDGGWHTWEVHEKSWELAQQFLKPFHDENLYICGEAFSTEQGWIEGALKTAEHVLLKIRDAGKGKSSINYSIPPSFPNRDKLEEYIEYQESESKSKSKSKAPAS